MIIITMFRRAFIAIFFLFGASRAIYAGGDSIVINCPLCLQAVSIQPPDPRMPFVLLHGELKHLHGVCQKCAFHLCMSDYLSAHCPICKAEIDSEVQRNSLQLSSTEWYQVNIANMACVSACEWEEIRCLQREKIEAEQAERKAILGLRQDELAMDCCGNAERYVEDGTDGGEATVLPEPVRPKEEMLRRDREEAERRLNESIRNLCGVLAQTEEMSQGSVRSEHEEADAKEGVSRCNREEDERCQRKSFIHEESRRASWTKTIPSGFMCRHRAVVGACVACAVAVGFMVWRASRVVDNELHLDDVRSKEACLSSNSCPNNRQQRSFVARLCARLGKLCLR